MYMARSLAFPVPAVGEVRSGTCVMNKACADRMLHALPLHKEMTQAMFLVCLHKRMPHNPRSYHGAASCTRLRGNAVHVEAEEKVGRRSATVGRAKHSLGLVPAGAAPADGRPAAVPV